MHTSRMAAHAVFNKYILGRAAHTHSLPQKTTLKDVFRRVVFSKTYFHTVRGTPRPRNTYLHTCQLHQTQSHTYAKIHKYAPCSFYTLTQALSHVHRDCCLQHSLLGSPPHTHTHAHTHTEHVHLQLLPDPTWATPFQPPTPVPACGPSPRWSRAVGASWGGAHSPRTAQNSNLVLAPHPRTHTFPSSSHRSAGHSPVFSDCPYSVTSSTSSYESTFIGHQNSPATLSLPPFKVPCPSRSARRP